MSIITDFKKKLTVSLAILSLGLFCSHSVTAATNASSQRGLEIVPTFENYDGKNCWIETANKYRLDPYLLFAIAMVESQLNPNAKNVNTNGSVDYGVMQINSIWYSKLESMGIPRSSLGDPCTSIQVGAWILAKNIYGMGYKWEAIGAYNASSYHKRMAYAKKVYAMYDMLKLWSSTYHDLYTKQFNATPAFVPKPPPAWVKYAYNNIK